jgi:hypothetical protein
MDTLLPPALFSHQHMCDGEWALSRRIAGRHTELCQLVDRRSGRGRYVKRIRRELRALTILHARGRPFVETVPAPICLLEDHPLLVTGATRRLPRVRPQA